MLAQRLADCWYGHCRWPLLLFPLALLFRLVVTLRRWAYRLGWLHADRLPVPVIVVGNITVGGTGKTPLVLWLVEQLQAAGYHPGVVSRGYGGRKGGESPVLGDSNPLVLGDEPVLIARRAGCPVWVGRRRAQAARALLAFHPEVDVIVADDGLQHYALARDLEIAVVDGARGLGNGWPLPVGPLREPAGRLNAVDAVVVNGGGGLDRSVHPPVYAMALQGERFCSLAEPGREVGAEAFRGRVIQALAGIGNPRRFFDHLAGLGLIVKPHPFPDHHAFRAADLPAGTLVMTEKDAVKCQAFAPGDAWFLAIGAHLDVGLNLLILERLKARHG